MTNPVADQPLPIVLLPGLNGDPRVFTCQAARVVRWPAPLRSERLADYARRVAGSLEGAGPCAVVGVSFGGIVAGELARHLEARCCVVVSSARDRWGLPAGVRRLRPVAAVTPAAVLRLGGGRPAFGRWAVWAMARWTPSGPPPCPVFQIHGSRDAVFPRGAATADRVVPGGGHLIARTHGGEVNAFIDDCVRETNGPR